MVTEEEREYIASQWRLIWWRFRRHRLALGASLILLAFLHCRPVPGVPVDPRSQRRVGRTHAQPPSAHPLLRRLEAGTALRLRPHRPEGPRHPQGEPQREQVGKVPDTLLREGHEYKHWKLFKSDLHLMGLGPEVAAPQPFYPLGTDRLGRDMWSRMMYGTRISMSIGLVGVGLSLFLGVLFGGLSGYAGGLVDGAIQRFIEFLRSIPTIPLWIALSVALPKDWSIIRIYFAITVIISLIGWTTLAREVRGPLPVDAGGGLCRGRPPVRVEPAAGHLPPHDALFRQPHNRHDDAGHTGHHHRRDLPQLPGSRHAAAGHKLGRAAVGRRSTCAPWR